MTEVAEPDLRLGDGRRVVAGAVLLHPDGRVLLQLRDDKPGIESPGCWSLFGGGLDEGETAQEGMTREVAEEIGFTVRYCRPLLMFDGWIAQYHVFLAAIDVPLEELVLMEGAGFDYWHPDALAAVPNVTELARLSLHALAALREQLSAKSPGSELLPGAGY